jgi:hypothetical protein
MVDGKERRGLSVDPSPIAPDLSLHISPLSPVDDKGEVRLGLHEAAAKKQCDGFVCLLVSQRGFLSLNG